MNVLISVPEPTESYSMTCLMDRRNSEMKIRVKDECASKWRLKRMKLSSAFNLKNICHQ